MTPTELVLQEVREALSATGESWPFFHGRKALATLNYDAEFPAVDLYPFRLVYDRATMSHKGTLLMSFLIKDDMGSSADQTEAIINQADAMAVLFRDKLMLSRYLTVNNVTTEPQYRVFAAVVSGMAVSIDIMFKDPC